MTAIHVLVRQDSVFVSLNTIETEKAAIGRDCDCEIRLPDPRVSRRHAILSLTGDGWQICDLQSRNGTFLNGNAVLEASPIPDGAEIDVAPYRLKAYFNLDLAIAASESPNDSTKSHRDFVVPGEVLNSTAALTPAQRRVHVLLLEGLVEKEIAARLGITTNTVHDHVKAIYKALAVTTRVQLFQRSMFPRTDGPDNRG